MKFSHFLPQRKKKKRECHRAVKSYGSYVSSASLFYEAYGRKKACANLYLLLVLAIVFFGSLILRPITVFGISNDNKANIVLFLADDHDIFYTNMYGPQEIKTPNMDQLARDGMVFKRAFTSTAICTPSRAMLYTGLYPHRNGAHPNHSATHPGIKSMPHYLTSLGYKVALAGKKGIKPLEVFPFEYIKMDEVEQFIKDAGSQPFCLIIASHEPHRPHKSGRYEPNEIIIPPYLIDTPETRQRIADYCTDIEILDKEIGQALDILNRQELEENTLFIYASDHGGPLPFGKWTCYDSGLHIPFIVRWPGKIKPGSSTNAMINLVDVLPTFIEIAGGTVTKDLDGDSFLPVMLGEKESHRKLIYGTHTNLGIQRGSEYPIRAVRSETYKYIVNLNPYGTFTNQITSDKKYGEFWNSWVEEAKRDTVAAERVILYMHRPAEELYNLRNDPYELNNLAKDPAQRDLILSMRKELMDWMAHQQDPMLNEMKKLMSSNITIHYP